MLLAASSSHPHVPSSAFSHEPFDSELAGFLDQPDNTAFAQLPGARPSPWLGLRGVELDLGRSTDSFSPLHNFNFARAPVPPTIPNSATVFGPGHHQQHNYRQQHQHQHNFQQPQQPQQRRMADSDNEHDAGDFDLRHVLSQEDFRRLMGRAASPPSAPAPAVFEQPHNEDAQAEPEVRVADWEWVLVTLESHNRSQLTAAERETLDASRLRVLSRHRAAILIEDDINFIRRRPPAWLRDDDAAFARSQQGDRGSFLLDEALQVVLPLFANSIAAAPSRASIYSALLNRVAWYMSHSFKVPAVYVSAEKAAQSEKEATLNIGNYSITRSNFAKRARKVVERLGAARAPAQLLPPAAAPPPAPASSSEEEEEEEEEEEQPAQRRGVVRTREQRASGDGNYGDDDEDYAAPAARRRRHR